MSNLPIQDDAEVRAITKQASDVRDLELKCVVEGPQEVEWATALLGEIAKAQRAAEERRVWFVQPLNEHVKAINGLFKNLVAPLVEADQTLRRKVLAYRHAEQQRIAAETARLQVEHDAREAVARAAITQRLGVEWALTHLGGNRVQFQAVHDALSAFIAKVEGREA